MAASIFIPVQNSEEKVQVFVDQLPNHNDLLDLLKAEQAPLDVWLSIAREYFKQGKIESFLEVLQEGSGPEVDEFYSDVKYERIAILNALGAYYTNLGKTNKRQRDEYFIKAVDFYNKAARIDSQELTTWVGKGQLQLAKGDWDNAAEMFNIVLQERPDHVPALLGQACVLFNKGKFQEALTNYKRVLQMHPLCSASVRLGIGLCHYRLQQVASSRADFHAAKARQAFERVLQLEPDNVEGLVALAMLDMNSDDVESVHRAMGRMRHAFETYPYSAMALNHLANHFFFTGEHHLVEPLMEAALACTGHTAMRAESYYNLARSFHSKGDFDKASFFYRHATQEMPSNTDFILPYYGLGQIHLKRGELDKALTALKKVLAVQPTNPEALKLVGAIQAKQGHQEEALASFRKVTSLHPSDAQAWIETAEILVHTDFGAALEALQTAHKLLKQQRAAVSLELLNDMAVLHLLRKEIAEAQRIFREALGPGPWTTLSEGPEPSPAAQNGESGKEGPSIANGVNGHTDGDAPEANGGGEAVPVEKVAVVFNLARLHEHLHETGRAAALYRLILKSHPEYVDGYLRLASMAQARCDWAASAQLIGRALEVSPRHVDALLLRSVAEGRQDDIGQAKESLKQCLEATGGKAPTPALLALGNWNLAMSSRPSKDPKAETVYLDKAREIFYKALSSNSSNMFAASGMGCVLAEKGQLDAAKDIFAQVQEAAAGSGTVEMPDVWANQAHVHLAKSETTLSMKMYQNCLKRFHYGTDAQALLYLARAQYEAELYEESTRTLLKGIHAAPTNHTLRFDAANVLQKHATVTLKKDKRTADQVRFAVRALKTAVRIFSQLVALGSQPAYGFDQKKSELHLEYCKHLLDTAKQHLETAEREEQQNKQRQEVARQLALVAEARQRAEEERKLEEGRLRREAEEELAAKMDAEFQARKAAWRKSTQPAPEEDGEGGEGGGKSKKEKKRKRKKNAEEDNFIVDEEEDQPQADRRNRSDDEGGVEAEQAGSAGRGEEEEEEVEEQGDYRGRNRSEEAPQDPDLVDMDAEAEPADGQSTKRRKRGRAIAESEDEDEGSLGQGGPSAAENEWDADGKEASGHGQETEPMEEGDVAGDSKHGEAKGALKATGLDDSDSE